jgi:hypothetical protein
MVILLLKAMKIREDKVEEDILKDIVQISVSNKKNVKFLNPPPS